MTTPLRPRHGAGGQVAACKNSLDCCALEHRLLFSAAPLDLTLLESAKGDEVSLHRMAHEMDAEPTASAQLIHSEQIPHELATLNSFVHSLDHWADDHSMGIKAVAMFVDDADHDGLELITDFLHLSDRPPVKASLSHTSLPENVDTSGGLKVGLLTTVDADQDEDFVYRIVGGEDADRFAIGGPLRDTLILCDGYLDAETQPIYEVHLRVTDSAGNERTEAMTITILDDTTEFAVTEIYDVDESLNQILEDAIVETLTGITVRAAGQDLADNVHYELIDDAGGRVSIDPSTSVVLMAHKSLLDRETNDHCSVQVQAYSDDGTTISKEFIVNTLDVDDHPFKFTTSSHVLAGEDSQTALIVSALDLDVPGQRITYSIAGGPDASAFSIEPETGVLRFLTQPDFETPHDIDQDNTYTVEITALDQQGETISQAIDISIMDLNDLPMATNDALYAKQETQLLISTMELVGNDTDNDGDALSIQLASEPEFGTLMLNADGTMSYQPNPGFHGTDHFTYYASDGQSASNLATVKIQVRADSIPQPPEATPVRTHGTSTAAPPAEVESEDASNNALLSVRRNDEPIGNGQPHVRKRLSTAMELDRHLPERAALIHVDSLVEDRVAHRIESLPSRTAPRGIETVREDRYCPSTAELLDQLNARAFGDQLDLMINTMSDNRLPEFAVAGATMTTAAMSIGYVVWTTRTSCMMASLVTATPVWKRIDPLPILEFAEVKESTTEGDDRSDIDRLLQDPSLRFVALK